MTSEQPEVIQTSQAWIAGKNALVITILSPSKKVTNIEEGDIVQAKLTLIKKAEKKNTKKIEQPLPIIKEPIKASPPTNESNLPTNEGGLRFNH